MGTAYVVVGRIEFGEDSWLDRPLPEVSDRFGYLFDACDPSPHTARTLLADWAGRELEGDLTEATVTGGSIELAGVLNEDDWNTYWGGMIHALALGAAQAGATGSIVGADMLEDAASWLEPKGGKLVRRIGDRDERIDALLGRAF